MKKYDIEDKQESLDRRYLELEDESQRQQYPVSGAKYKCGCFAILPRFVPLWSIPNKCQKHNKEIEFFLGQKGIIKFKKIEKEEKC